MTVGTGFSGRSSLTENLEPKHLVQWTRLAYDSDPAEAFGNFTGLIPWESTAGPVPPYPIASNAAQGGRAAGAYLDADRTPRPGTPLPHDAGGAGFVGHEDRASGPAYGGLDAHALREEIRRVVIEELAQFAGGFRG
jgi:hypothetical protein